MRKGAIPGRQRCRKLYRLLPHSEKEKLKARAREVCGEYAEAVIEFISTEKSSDAVALKHYISEPTLYRNVNIFYESI